MRFQDMGRLMAGDHVYIFVPDRYPRLLDRLFASRTEVDPEDADFFGAFAVDPGRPAADLEAAYAPGLSEAEKKLTIGALIETRLGGRAEYADRVTLGPIELIVRDVDDDGKITGRRPLLRAGRDGAAHSGLPQRRRDRRPAAPAVGRLAQDRAAAPPDERRAAERKRRRPTLISPSGRRLAAIISRLASPRARAKVRRFSD